MKKTIALLSASLCLVAAGYAQPKLNKKEATKILKRAWEDVKKSDTADFVKLWVLDNVQWPYHGGQKFDRKDVYANYRDFRSYFDTALIKNLKLEDVGCDTVEHNDPHYEYAKYYIHASFKFSKTHSRGFGFYMDYVNKEWLVRFSPEYSDQTTRK